jgi:hypothetical protein
MKPHRLAALLVVALAALCTVGGAPGASAETCRTTDAVFYTSVTVTLATELSKSASACADYYISITPNTGGVPRGGTALETVHSLGSHFHALAEIRLAAWADWASTHGGFYAAGVEVRREMGAVGYDAARDTWAVNEVGEPSTVDMGVDVLKGNKTARDDFRDFVRGLYTGDDASSPGLRGLVFAADPPQVTSDLSGYEQELENFYADASFWQDMNSYVRFWGQETYAGADVWGVAGRTLPERTSYLNDYFLHGLRLAQREDGRTATARAFLAKTYTPIGNAAFSWPAPDPVKGGFGRTNIGLPGMLNFVSTQTYALRVSSGDRFGFAVVPNPSNNPGTTSVEDRVAAAIHDSESDPLGACSTNAVFCDSSVAGASFNDAWKVFANTLEGPSVEVQVAPGVSVTYAAVTARGSTWTETSPATATAPPRFQLLPGALEYDLATTAVYTAPVDVCVPYDAGVYDGFEPHLFQLTSAGWTDVTTSGASSAVCGRSDTLGPFVVFAADPSPPLIVPHIDGQLGNDDWYVGDVTVTWSVVEPQSPSSVTTSGCDPRTITNDTSGITLTCTATSDGGTAAESVTVKRDATPPTVACPPTPSTLWPPNGKLVPVTVATTVADELSGAGGFLLTDADTNLGDRALDIVGFDVGTADVAGLLRAKRPGTADERVYSLTFVGQDLAGNTAECVAHVDVPHDQGT